MGSAFWGHKNTRQQRILKKLPQRGFWIISFQSSFFECSPYLEIEMVWAIDLTKQPNTPSVNDRVYYIHWMTSQVSTFTFCLPFSLDKVEIDLLGRGLPKMM